MTIIFDGKKVASDLRVSLKKEALKLPVKPKLVSILVGEDRGGKKYLSLKKDAAKDIGAKLEIRDFGRDTKPEEIIDEIEDLNTKERVHGVMVQLPLPEDFSEKEKDQIIEAIDRKKDVDGMKDESLFVAPVVKATLLATKIAGEVKAYEENSLFVVVGAEGFVGGKILRALEDMGFRSKGLDVGSKGRERTIKEADVVISTTGQKGTITKKMVKDGVVLIDVGVPHPEVAEEAGKKSLFITPVPGGIGPLTIEFLLENLVEATKEQG